jgi:hypothetical protein
MYNVIVYRYTEAPTKCPGGWGENSGEYDPEADFLYHSDNPEAPACNNGLIGEIASEEIKGFYFSELKESQMMELDVGTLDENEGIFIVDGFVDLENIVTLEYPSGEYHQFIFKRDLKIGEDVIAQYGKVRKSNGVL